MEKENFIYKGFDYSFMDDAGKAIMAKRIKQDKKEEAEQADSPKGYLKEIWDKINHHTDYGWLHRHGLLEGHLRRLKVQYASSRRTQPFQIYQPMPVNPNIKNLNIIESEIDKD